MKHRTTSTEARPAVAGWQGWLSHLSGRGPERVPTIVETLTRTSVMGSWLTATQQRELADLVIAPDVAGTGLMEFAAIDKLVDRGRAAARAALDSAPALLPRAG